MNRNKGLLLVTVIFCAIFATLTCLSALAQYPRFYVCITNETNNYLKYQTEWCTRAGENCSGYRMWTIAPGETIKHWGPHGNGRMDVNIHTGGPGGTYLDYSFDGTTGGCAESSSHAIQYNNRGFLRIY